MRCFECLQRVSDPENLFDHLRTVHKIKGNYDYKCSFCPSEFDTLGTFKTHVRNCFKKNEEKCQADQLEQTASMDEALKIHHDMTMEYSDEVADFKDFVQKSALEMVLKMSSNMNIPRSLVFDHLSDFQMFIKNILINGMTFRCLSVSM